MENKENKKKQTKGAANSLQSILGGSFLTHKSTAKHLPFLFFLAFIAIIYIGNSYYAEKKIRKIEDLQKELKEIRYQHISTKSHLMQNSRQSKVSGSLNNKGIKESTVPPVKIFVNNE